MTFKAKLEDIVKGIAILHYQSEEGVDKILALIESDIVGDNQNIPQYVTTQGTTGGELEVVNQTRNKLKQEQREKLK